MREGASDEGAKGSQLLRQPARVVAGLAGSGVARFGGWQPGWKHANDPLIPSRDIGHSLTRPPTAPAAPQHAALPA